MKDTGRIQGYLKKKTLAANQMALKESLAIGYSDGVVVASMFIITTLFEQGNFDSCKKYFDLAYKHVVTPNFRNDLLSTLYLNHGTYYYLQGNYVAADSLYYLGLKSVKKDKMFNAVTFSLLYNLHFIKSEMGEKQLALDYINKAEKFTRDNHDSPYLRMALIAKSQFFMEAKQMDSAKKYLAESIAVSKGELNLDQMSVESSQWSNSDSPWKAIPLLQKAIARAIRDKIDFYKILNTMNLGQVYNRMNQFNKAESVLAPVIKESLQKGFVYTLRDGFLELATAYEKQGKFKSALEMLKNAHKANDSLFNRDKIKTLNELELKYKTAEKDKQLTLNELKISQQKNEIAKQTTWIISISGIVLLLTVVLLSYTVVKRNQINSLKQQQEINNLRSRMEGEENERQRLARELHDGIGGLLSSALMQTSHLLEENPQLDRSGTFEALRSIIKESAVDVRKTANNLMPDPIIKLGLTGAIEQYCLSVKKFADYKINFQSYGEINDVRLSMKLAIYRIIQELVHNITKHSGATEVLIQVAAYQSIAGITVEDNGKGFDDKNIQAGSGLNNIQQRVEGLNGKFSLVSSPGKGTSVNIELPV